MLWGTGRAGAAPAVLLHRPPPQRGLVLLICSAGYWGMSLASEGSRSHCFCSSYVNHHAGRSWLSLCVAFLRCWSRLG